MSDHLVPEEILTEILIKLPVKSLIRFTSVCKEWRSLIRSPYFISTHLSHAENQAFVQRYAYDNNKCLEFYMVIPKTGPLVINSLESPAFTCQFEFPRIVGSCEGLVCFSDDYHPCVIIWNPAVRNHVVLPRPEVLVNPHHVLLGFGVASNVYKVLRLVYRRNPNGDGLIVPPRAEVFSLGTETWRTLTGFDDDVIRGLVPRNPGCPVFCEGFLHWIGCDGDENGERNSILRFHVGDEVFDEIMLPRELERVPWFTGVILYKMGANNLGVCKYDEDGLKLDVWMMKESWSKLYTIDTAVIRFNEAIGFLGSGEALLYGYTGELVTYNAKTKEIKHVWDFGNNMSFYVGDYKESLVLLGG